MAKASKTAKPRRVEPRVEPSAAVEPPAAETDPLEPGTELSDSNTRLLVAMRQFEIARARLEHEIASDNARRHAEFLRTVSRPTAPPRALVEKQSLAGFAKRLRAAPGYNASDFSDGPRTLRLIAEGDSWFKYVIGNAVISNLAQELGYEIENMASPGDVVSSMLDAVHLEQIVRRMTRRTLRYDALLFSGGGNDLVGPRGVYFRKVLRPVAAGAPASEMLDLAAVDRGLRVLEDGYRLLIRRVQQASPGTVLVLHQYDFPPVNERGACWIDPWLSPPLDEVYAEAGRPTDRVEQAGIVKLYLQQFAAMLAKVAADFKDVLVVPTQGTLAPTDADWANELHPTNSGFRKIARKFKTTILDRFKDK